MTAEHLRLDEARAQKAPWKKWGPYLSERQWGTVREDYSPSGDAWNYFTHDQARSRVVEVEPATRARPPARRVVAPATDETQAEVAADVEDG